MKKVTRVEPVSTISNINFIRELGGIREYELESNGLRILLIPDESMPVVGCAVTYQVGSRNEVSGHTGSAHILEHLTYKATKKFDTNEGNSIKTQLGKKAALLNANTWFDRTYYFEIIHCEALPLVLEIESERMRNVLFREEDLKKEMLVVHNEFNIKENSPHQALLKEVCATAFVVHPYHHPTIGWLSDIEKVSIEKLQQFYNDYYWPNNATLTVAGHFDEKDTLRQVERLFGIHPKSPNLIPDIYAVEPKQESQRRVTLRRNGTPVIEIAYKIPNAHHADIPVLIVLENILFSHEVSRLHLALIDTAYATSVFTKCWQMHDPSLFRISASPALHNTYAKVEKIIYEQCQLLTKEVVSQTELAQAKQTIRIDAAKKRDGLQMLLTSLCNDIATGNWTRFVTLSDAIEKVTAEDVRRVAQMYFTSNQSTIGWFVSANKK